jgi:hypothetical protein
MEGSVRKGINGLNRSFGTLESFGQLKTAATRHTVNKWGLDRLPITEQVEVDQATWAWHPGFILQPGSWCKRHRATTDGLTFPAIRHRATTETARPFQAASHYSQEAYLSCKRRTEPQQRRPDLFVQRKLSIANVQRPTRVVKGVPAQRFEIPPCMMSECYGWRARANRHPRRPVACEGRREDKTQKRALEKGNGLMLVNLKILSSRLIASV